MAKKTKLSMSELRAMISGGKSNVRGTSRTIVFRHKDGGKHVTRFKSKASAGRAMAGWRAAGGSAKYL